LLGVLIFIIRFLFIGRWKRGLIVKLLLFRGILLTWRFMIQGGDDKELIEILYFPEGVEDGLVELVETTLLNV